MRQRLAVSLLSALLVASFVQPALAQRRRGLVDITPSGERHGFWMNIGVGAGSESSIVDSGATSFYSDAVTKPAYSLRIGGTVSPNFRLGVELAGWADRHYDPDPRVQDYVTSYLAGLMLIGQVYPSSRSGFFVKGGAGVSRAGDDVAGPGGDLHEDGFAFTAGLGYEIRLGRSLYLTPTVDFLQHRSQIRGFNGVLEPPFRDRLVTVGVALTIQPGR